MTKDEMIKTLPKLYRKDKWIHQIYNSAQLDEVDKQSRIDYNNIFMTTLDDYGCTLYERDLLLDAKEKLEDRRSAIITRWRANYRCTLQLLQDIVNQWFGDKCDVTYDGNATVTHTTKVGTRYDPNSYYYQTFLKHYMDVFPAHFNLVWNHTHNRWIDYCKPHNWGYAKSEYLNWNEPHDHKWGDEKSVIRGKYWNYNLTRTWDDVYDNAIYWEDNE